MLTNSASKVKYGRRLFIENYGASHCGSNRANEFTSARDVLVLVGQLVEVCCVVLDYKVVIVAVIVSMVMMVGVTMIMRVRCHLRLMGMVVRGHENLGRERRRYY